MYAFTKILTKEFKDENNLLSYSQLLMPRYVPSIMRKTNVLHLNLDENFLIYGMHMWFTSKVLYAFPFG